MAAPCSVHVQCPSSLQIASGHTETYLSRCDVAAGVGALELSRGTGVEVVQHERCRELCEEGAGRELGGLEEEQRPEGAQDLQGPAQSLQGVQALTNGHLQLSHVLHPIRSCTSEAIL